MASFRKIEILNCMLDTGLIPIFYHTNIEISKQIIRACYEGGIRVFEFTNRGDYAHEYFAQLNRWVGKEWIDFALGIGSIVDEATASLYLQLGANFVVSPLLNPAIVKLCNRRQVPCIPGCGSVSEIGYAHELGASMVKIFPATSTGGADFIKNILAPMPWTNIMATGGIELYEEELKEWFQAGAACIGVGSKLFTEDEIAQQQWGEISKKCKETMAIIDRARSNKKKLR